MSELLIEIYNHLMERDKDAIKMQNKVNTEMEQILVSYKDNLSEEELEKLNYLLYDVLYVAEREAILYGIKLIMKLLLEL